MNKLTFPLLQLLSNGQFHSGEALARQFNVSRATIWNAIQQAESLGITIYSVRGRGYKLPQSIDFFDPKKVLSTIGEQQNLFNLIVLDEVASTNTYLMQQKNMPHATCVAAHIQTSGKGRRGRIWVSRLGASLTFSVLWRFQCGAAALSGLSLAVGVALIRALKNIGIEQAQLKWPNDVLILDENQQSKKLAGILIELQGDLDGPSSAVIGVGINLNLPKMMIESIDQPTTDLHKIAGYSVNQNLLLGTILKHLAEVLVTFEQLGFAGLREEWLSCHAYHQQPVRLLMPNATEVFGVVEDVAEDGILMVQTQHGLQRFYAGEISLRPSTPGEIA